VKRCGGIFICIGLSIGSAGGSGWIRHVIDNTSAGADGVRLADVNRDGMPDIVTGWEEGGSIRVYLNPGPRQSGSEWPRVEVGRVASPEDAVLVDLDGDGALDVVSSCEGSQRAMFVHWAPRTGSAYRDASAWKTERFTAAAGVRWMFSAPLQLDARHGPDLIAGAKNEQAALGWFEAPADPRDLSAWQWHPLRDMGWTMSIIPTDMDGDGDLDILASDRRPPRSGAFWLENPGPGERQRRPWTEHLIGAQGLEVMFLSTADMDGDGFADVLSAVAPRSLMIHHRKDKHGRAWRATTIPLPEQAGTAKAVSAGDMNGDGRPDLVFSCENAIGEKRGVMWLAAPDWQPHDISGPAGTKYDLVELIDMDGDGDLDVLTCEERENLGVIWYENPAVGRQTRKPA
jgi:hypothetical protein